MASEKGAAAPASAPAVGLEWKVSIPEGSSAKVVESPERYPISRLLSAFLRLVLAAKAKVTGFLAKAWKMGLDDPRKVCHGLKVGLALTLVSFFYYARPLYDGVGGNAMWAVMTVVVVSEFTIGGTLYKGFNRVTATFTAGSLAFGVHWVASKSGEKAEPVVAGAALFLLASAATFSRFIPTIKARFDYGVTIFILTFSLVSVSGYRVEELMEMAQQRLATVGIGCSICLVVCMLIRPVWAGQDLHDLVARNMDKLATSLEACVAGYFEEGGCGGDGKPCQTSQGYKSLLISKASEDSLANLARWEPSHGLFSFRHPWKQYLKVAAAMRHCAYCVEILSGSVNTSTAFQPPEFLKMHLRPSCMELASKSSRILKELSTSIKSMTKPSNVYALVEEMNSALEDLQGVLRDIPSQHAEPNVPPPPQESSPADQMDKEKSQPVMAVSLMDLVTLVRVASTLIEFSGRMEEVINSVDALAQLASFKDASDEKPE